MDWQAIDSAPKDGREIVLCFYSDWSEKWLFWVDHWRTYHGSYGEGWGGTAGHPTHWAPLPSLPAPPEETTR